MDDTNPTGVPLGLHDPTNRQAIEAALPAFVRTRRWFGAKARPIREIRIADSLTIGHGDAHESHMAIGEIVFEDGDSAYYVMPINIDMVSDHGQDRANTPGEIARWEADTGLEQSTLVASDATLDSEFASGLLDAIWSERRWTGDNGDILAWSTPQLAAMLHDAASLDPSVIGTEQSNTSISYGHTIILKLFRRLEEGTSPELDMGRALQAANFRKTPPLGGAIEYVRRGGEPITLGVLQGYVANRGDAWRYTLATLAGYFDRTLGGDPPGELSGTPNADLLDLASRSVPPAFDELAGGFTASAVALGHTTAQMHLALASVGVDQAFGPEHLDLEYLEHMYGAMRLLVDQAFGLLQANRKSLPPEVGSEADAVLRRSDDIAQRFEAMIRGDIGGMRTRVHGDYHLGQVLYTGSEFYIIDFEGEPARSLAERRRKHSPLKDVAGMVRSFHYAAYSGLFNYGREHGVTVSGKPGFERWADAWYAWAVAAFLGEYMRTVAGSGLLPADNDGVRVLLSAHLLEKAVYELVYELNNRPTWVAIPLKGIAALLS